MLQIGCNATSRSLAASVRDIRLIETLGRRCGLAGMEVSRVVALRGPGWLALDPPAALLGWLSNDVPGLPGPRRGVAQKRRERHTVLESGVPATVPSVPGRGR